MLEVKPFCALRFDTNKAGDIASLCCPPYDIISDEQRRAYLAHNEHNIIRLELPRGEEPYAQAGRTLESWLAQGVLRQDARAGIYVYEEAFTARGEEKRVRGFISRVRLCEFSEGVVLPHEETLSKAKADRFSLMQSTFCNFSQIYSLYFDENGAVERLLDTLCAGEPEQAFTDDDGVTHRLWCAYEGERARELAALMEQKRAFIADGHHRYETALNFRRALGAEGRLSSDEHPANYVMMMLVAMENPGLVVFPTHRIVRGIPAFSAERVLEACRASFTIKACTGAPQPVLDAAYAAGEKSMVLYTGKGAWSLLTLQDENAMKALLPEASEAYRGLDVSILHTLVLERALGIDKENMANQKNLTYTRDAAEAMAAVDNGEADCAFLINPTRVSEIAAVAAAGEKMPQKSTYFYPKLITGLVMNRMEE